MAGETGNRKQSERAWFVRSSTHQFTVQFLPHKTYVQYSTPMHIPPTEHHTNVVSGVNGCSTHASCSARWKGWLSVRDTKIRMTDRTPPLTASTGKRKISADTQPSLPPTVDPSRLSPTILNNSPTDIMNEHVPLCRLGVGFPSGVLHPASPRKPHEIRSGRALSLRRDVSGWGRGEVSNRCLAVTRKRTWISGDRQQFSPDMARLANKSEQECCGVL